MGRGLFRRTLSLLTWKDGKIRKTSVVSSRLEPVASMRVTMELTWSVHCEKWDMLSCMLQIDEVYFFVFIVTIAS
jgi:hypothetical protein